MSFQLHLVFWIVRTLVFSVGDTDCSCLNTKCNIGSLLLHQTAVHLLTTYRVPNYKRCPAPCDPRKSRTLAPYCLHVACPSSQTIHDIRFLKYIWVFAVRESSLFLISFHEKFSASPRGKMADVRSSDLNSCLPSLAHTVLAKSVFWLSCIQDTSGFDLALAIGLQIFRKPDFKPLKQSNVKGGI